MTARGPYPGTWERPRGSQLNYYLPTSRDIAALSVATACTFTTARTMAMPANVEGHDFFSPTHPPQSEGAF
eukprot:6214009-Pleurochrysis_carterae.AAC.2